MYSSDPETMHAQEEKKEEVQDCKHSLSNLTMSKPI
jgi:hypothetical protein